jgi:hypothetical protein
MKTKPQLQQAYLAANSLTTNYNHCYRKSIPGTGDPVTLVRATDDGAKDATTVS